MSGLENSAILNSESNPNLNSTVGHNQSSKKGATTVTSGGGGPNSVSSTNKLGFNLNYNTSSKLASTNKLVGSVQVSYSLLVLALALLYILLSCPFLVVVVSAFCFTFYCPISSMLSHFVVFIYCFYYLYFLNLYSCFIKELHHSVEES